MLKCRESARVVLASAALLLLIPMTGRAQENVLVNGDFSQGCSFWEFTDVSEPHEPGDEPWATIDCSNGYADVHCCGMYGRGLLEQSFSCLRPERLSFDYWGLLTSDHGIRAWLFREDTLVVDVYCEHSPSGGQFNRIEVWILGTHVIDVHDQTPPEAHVEILLTDTSVVAYLNGEEAGSGQIPEGSDLRCNRIGIFAGVSNDIDAHIYCDNVSLIPSSFGPSSAEAVTWTGVKHLFR